MAALRPVDADLVVAGHLVMHRLPLAAPAEGRWRGVGDSFDDRDQPRGDRTRVEVLAGRYVLARVVVPVPPEEMNAPRSDRRTSRNRAGPPHLRALTRGRRVRFHFGTSARMAPIRAHASLPRKNLP